MIFITVDDEPYALKDLMDSLEEVAPDVNIQGFSAPSKALEFAKTENVDIAFLDIEMCGMNGLELARKLKEIYGKTNIIFVTGFSEHALEAFAAHACGYLLKPVSPSAIKESLDYLYHPIKLESKGLRVQTFGNFEVFYNEAPLRFPRSKSKELFAYLIYKRGTSSTIKELMGVLFEDKTYNLSMQNQMQTLISTMMKVLNEVNAGDIVVRNFNSLSVNMSKINCDFYRFLNWEIDAINAYTGEFMANYSWAEFAIGYLDSKVL